MEYIKVLKRLRSDLKNHKMVISDELFCIAILTGTNLDANNKLNVEGVARNSDPNHKLTVRGLEDALLTLKSTTEVSESLYCADYQEEEQINWTRWQKWAKQQKDETNLMKRRADEPSKWPIIDSGASKSVISEKDAIEWTIKTSFSPE